jgi:hypothetical protein
MSSEEKMSLQVLRNETMGDIESLRKMFLGDILTLVEATFADSEQRKSFKRVVSDTFWNPKEQWTVNINRRFGRYAKSIGEILDNDEVVGDELPS